MTFDEAKEVLSLATALTGMRVDAAVVVLWQDVLDPYTKAECLWALREFARTNKTDYLRPAHLIEIVQQKRAEYAWANPGRAARQVDSWLGFERQLDVARAEVRAVQATGKRLAVEAMESEQEGEEQ